MENNENFNVNVEVKENKKKNNKVLMIVIGIMAIIIIGLGAYILLDKNEKKVEDNSNSNSNQNLNDVDISSSLIKNLAYPIGGDSSFNKWEYINIVVAELDRDAKMQIAYWQVNLDNYEEEDYQDGTGYFIPASIIESNFKKIFGPDTEYSDATISKPAMYSLEYISSKKSYFQQTGRGELSIGWEYEIKLYKATQNAEYLYTYFYVQPYYSDTEEVYMIDSKNVKTDLNYSDKELENSKLSKDIVWDDVQKIAKSKIDNGEAGTYKFTFKKASDGTYYFYSGNWEK